MILKSQMTNFSHLGNGS